MRKKPTTKFLLQNANSKKKLTKLETSEEAGCRILRQKYTEKTDIRKTELFTSSRVTYENTGNAAVTEQVQAVIGMFAALDSEKEIRSWIRRMQSYAEDTIQAADNPAQRRKHASHEQRWEKLREHAQQIVYGSTCLLDALNKSDLFRAVRFAALLERSVIKCDLEFKGGEENAERGRELQESMQRRSSARWNTPERHSQKELLTAEAKMLRDLYPSLSTARIALRILKLHPTVRLTQRTIVKLVPPKIV